MEIGPLYPEVNKQHEPDQKRIYNSYEAFLHTYEPFLFTSISRKQALTWKKHLYDMLEPIVRGCRDDIFSENS